MRLKSYQSDGRLLRTGAANFSASGLKRQDNDLIVIKDAQAAAKFQHTFEAQFAMFSVSKRNSPQVPFWGLCDYDDCEAIAGLERPKNGK
jgi:phosphatidylserine/phosphatidylglycerophosphate/cardiolipin synthase-like enzyme